ncbi:MAG: DUF433 domain-containing protein [Oscillatoria sp. PMC 1051.18]|uniref:DUF433 domain-containing protein n=1 Tax=Oscillatoria salina TaxID=331517 RepID=UPI0013BBD1AE|nr:DUF433 domain-containing protein [Oscillatoria salina]MBZ8181635.1 DUF433 domain-containing protein [Oscillatoria salina IIICB1]MEC4893526.1 DUF433 domain-containing protein [Oscillatoria sp. PMC 1050.18]MEC5030247.1 DUF433 domain-containing protein [Oscillatoria sp. PMC 1051.18]NET88682.1 DUF433 domain-containing protein [Kamptonema sp. SIO1D9]
MKLQELKKQILSLSSSEKAEIMQILTESLSNGSSGITKTPGVVGGDACIAKTRIPVWMLVSLRRQGSTDAELLYFYPQLNAIDLVNAWAYAEAFTEEIEKALQQQAEV